MDTLLGTNISRTECLLVVLWYGAIAVGDGVCLFFLRKRVGLLPDHILENF
jgi:hypothetical protein